MRILSPFFALLTIFSLPSHALTAGPDSLRVGDAAPDFTLPMATQDTIDMIGISLSDEFRRGPVILAFYPADWSSGCTAEMCTVRDNFVSLSGLGVKVYGISGDYVFSHREWARRLDLPFALLSDHDHTVARQYQSYNERRGMNLRTVFVVGTNGRLLYVDRGYSSATPGSFDALKRFVSSRH
jgi:peroxiredoxin